MIQLEEKGNGLCVIKIIMQEVHTLDVPELKEKIQHAVVDKSIKKLVLDLSDVKIITSTGIGIFLNINQILKSQLKLAAPNDEIKKVLELTKVTTVIKIYNSVDEAVKSFQ